MAPAVATYAPRDPSHTVLYHVIAEPLETFLASLADDPEATGLPTYMQREFYDYVRCGILAHGFLRLGCDTCKKELLVPFSCKRRGFCPSCAGRCMAQMAASVQQRIAFGARAGQRVRRIGAGFGHESETPRRTGPRCASVHGFSLHANTHISAHRHDQLERLMRSTARGAVSLERLQEDANGDLVYTFTHPWADGTTGITLSPLELLEKLAALVPLPRVHLVRYAGCLAPHSHLRMTIRPTPRQQGVDEAETPTGTPYWHWARLLGRVLHLVMVTCPFCQCGTLRLIAVITQGAVIRKILRHLKLAEDPLPIAPARARQERYAFD
jgi:putative transposase/transposase-like zinc-binding protein